MNKTAQNMKKTVHYLYVYSIMMIFLFGGLVTPKAEVPSSNKSRTAVEIPFDKKILHYNKRISNGWIQFASDSVLISVFDDSRTPNNAIAFLEDKLRLIQDYEKELYSNNILNEKKGSNPIADVIYKNFEMFDLRELTVHPQSEKKNGVEKFQAIVGIGIRLNGKCKVLGGLVSPNIRETLNVQTSVSFQISKEENAIQITRVIPWGMKPSEGITYLLSRGSYLNGNCFRQLSTSGETSEG